MAYDKTAKKLYVAEGSGITPWEVAQCLDDYRVNSMGQRDVGMLCTSPNINMWSWVKPIQNTSWKPLSHDDFKGTLSDHNDNIYFGIKINASLSSNLTDELATIHDATYEYIRPTGPFRLLDFNGYNHYARPNPGATWPNENAELLGDWDDALDVGGSLKGIYVGYTRDSDGVDFSSMLQDTSVTLDYVLARAYPCLLVTDSMGKSYFTALYNSSAGGATPLLYNGVYQSSGDWRCKFAKPAYDPAFADRATNPWNANQDNMRASVILVRSASATEPLLNIGGGNFEENWIKLASSGTVGTAKPAIIVGATGASLKLIRIALEFRGTVSVMAGNGQKVRVTASIYEASGFESDEEVQVKITVTINGSSFSSTRTYNSWHTGDSPGLGTTFITDMQHTQGTTYRGKLRIVTDSFNRSSIYETEYSVTP